MKQKEKKEYDFAIFSLLYFYSHEWIGKLF